MNNIISNKTHVDEDYKWKDLDKYSFKTKEEKEALKKEYEEWEGNPNETRTRFKKNVKAFGEYKKISNMEYLLR